MRESAYLLAIRRSSVAILNALPFHIFAEPISRESDGCVEYSGASFMMVLTLPQLSMQRSSV